MFNEEVVPYSSSYGDALIFGVGVFTDIVLLTMCLPRLCTFNFYSTRRIIQKQKISSTNAIGA